MSFGWDGIAKSNAERIVRKSFPAELSAMDEVFGFLTAQAQSVSCDEKMLDRLMVIAEEIFVNIASYAYENGGEAEISCVPTDNPKCIHILFADNGVAYNPTLRTAQDAEESVKNMTPGGLGILMVRKLSDAMEYASRDGKNLLYIKKILGE